MPIGVAHLSLEISGNLFLDAGSNSWLTSLSLSKFSLYKGLAIFCLWLSKIFGESLPVSFWDPSPAFLWLIYSPTSFLIIFNSSYFPVLLTKRTLPPPWTNPFPIPHPSLSVFVFYQSIAIIQKTVKLLTGFILLAQSEVSKNIFLLQWQFKTQTAFWALGLLKTQGWANGETGSHN